MTVIAKAIVFEIELCDSVENFLSLCPLPSMVDI